MLESISHSVRGLHICRSIKTFLAGICQLALHKVQWELSPLVHMDTWTWRFLHSGFPARAESHPGAGEMNSHPHGQGALMGMGTMEITQQGLSGEKQVL